MNTLWMDRPEVERLVIGWLFVHPEAFGDCEDLEPAAFHRGYPYRPIYRAMLATQPVTDPDFLNVVRTLQETGELNEIGGPAVVAATVDDLPGDFPFTEAVALLVRTAREDADGAV